jgi:hypothetical protein
MSTRPSRRNSRKQISRFSRHLRRSSAIARRRRLCRPMLDPITVGTRGCESVSRRRSTNGKRGAYNSGTRDSPQAYVRMSCKSRDGPSAILLFWRDLRRQLRHDSRASASGGSAARFSFRDRCMVECQTHDTLRRALATLRDDLRDPALDVRDRRLADGFPPDPLSGILSALIACSARAAWKPLDGAAGLARAKHRGGPLRAPCGQRRPVFGQPRGARPASPSRNRRRSSSRSAE